MCETAADEASRSREVTPASHVWLSHCAGSGLGPTLGREEAQTSVVVQKVACCGKKLKELSLVS